MARRYANENFRLPVVMELRRSGHDVLTIQETGQGGRAESDENVLAFACTENRADFVGQAERIHVNRVAV